jgi:hypothetical protein
VKKNNTNSAAEGIKKFISNFYKDLDIDDISVAYGMYDLPYIIVWYQQKDPEDRRDYINFRQRIIEDVENYLGYRLSPDPTSFIGSGSRGKYVNSDFYLDVRSNNVKN